MATRCSDDAGSGREDWRKDCCGFQRLVSSQNGDRLDGKGVITIEGSMNGPLGDYCTQGRCEAGCPAFSWRTLAGDSGWRGALDIAVARRHADMFGTRRLARQIGLRSLVCAGRFHYADHVIVVTDNPCRSPASRGDSGNNVDYVVEVIHRDPARIVSGTDADTRSPDRLRIAEFVARFLREAGIMKKGFLPGRPGHRPALRRLPSTDDERRWREGRFVRGVPRISGELLQED